MFSPVSTPFAEENPLTGFQNSVMSIYNKTDYPVLFKLAQELYLKSCDDDLKDFPLSEREKFLKSGNRQDFEKLYFKRRDYLSATAILSLFDDSYISKLEKVISAVCDECSWMLPAHIIHGENFIDLFVAETSFALAEISTVFKDKMTPETYNRVRKEIKSRLLDNYIQNTFWWEGCEMNWASVCASYIGGTLLYLFPGEFLKLRERILKTLERYISGFTDDGFCFEGPSYWQYGFTAYCVFADMLYKFTAGKSDLFDCPKIKNIASYGEKCRLKGGASLSFSDSDMKFTADYALQNYIHGKLPGTSPCRNMTNDNLAATNTKWINCYRAVIWEASDDITPSLKNKGAYSPVANQLIVNKDIYSFAFKGGSNGEPHNHNDLGSFIYADNDGQVFCDLGSGRYTGDYFDEKKRYGIFCNSSFSHSVPVINGKSQLCGKEYTASLSCENGTAVCDITKPYGEKELISALREAEIKENGITITDKFRFCDNLCITERFVSLRKAEIKKDALVFGRTKMLYPLDKVILSVKEEKHTPHEYNADDITVYCYDFLLKEGVSELSFEIITE